MEGNSPEPVTAIRLSAVKYHSCAARPEYDCHIFIGVPFAGVPLPASKLYAPLSVVTAVLPGDKDHLVASVAHF